MPRCFADRIGAVVTICTPSRETTVVHSRAGKRVGALVTGFAGRVGLNMARRFSNRSRARMTGGARRRDATMIQPRTGKRVRALVTGFAGGVSWNVARRLSDGSCTGMTRGARGGNTAMVYSSSGECDRAAMAIFARCVGYYMFGRLADRAAPVMAARTATGGYRVVRLRRPVASHTRIRAKGSKGSAAAWAWRRQPADSRAGFIGSRLWKQVRRARGRICCY